MENPFISKINMIIEIRSDYYLLYIEDVDDYDYGLVFAYDKHNWSFVHNSINNHIGVGYINDDRKEKFDSMFSDYIESLRDNKINEICNK